MKRHLERPGPGLGFRVGGPLVCLVRLMCVEVKGLVVNQITYPGLGLLA